MKNKQEANVNAGQSLHFVGVSSFAWRTGHIRCPPTKNKDAKMNTQNKNKEKRT